MWKFYWKCSLMILTLSFMAANNAHATAQAAEMLIHEGNDYPIYTNPLESYFNDNHPRPNDIFKFSCTSVWRGYIGTWIIEDNFLKLIKLVKGTCDKRSSEIPLSKIFPGLTAPIEAFWFSGTIIIPQGKCVHYVHMRYGSTYERYILITVSKGAIKRVLKLEMEEFLEFRKAQFDAYKRTKEYLEKFEELSRCSKDQSEVPIEDFLYEYDAEHYLSLDFSSQETNMGPPSKPKNTKGKTGKSSKQ